MKKLRFPALLLSVILLLTSLPCLLASCGRSKAPALDAVRGRLEEVLDASVDINAILFGAGLPVYERGSAEDELIGRYFALRDDGTELVTPYARYFDTEEIELALRSVYCKKYADSLCEMLFTGYSMGSSSGSILAARYSKDENGLYQSSAYEPLISGIRIYDYSSMEMDPASNADFIKIRIDFRRDEPASEWTQTTLTFVSQDGTWYLDSPCY